MKKNALITNSAYYMAGTFFYFFFQWLTTVLVVRLAGYEQAGVFSIAISFSNLSFFVAKFGIRNYQVSDTGGQYTSDQYLGARIVAACLALVVFEIGLLVSDFPRKTVVCCAIYMLFKYAEAATDHQFSILQKYDEYGAILFSYFAKGCLSLVGFVAGLYFFASLEIAMIWMLLLYGISMLYDLKIQRQREKMGCSFRGCSGILRNCFPLMLSSLVPPYMNFIVRYFIQNRLGDEELGYYSSFAAIVVVMTTLAGAIWVVLLPKISADFQNRAYHKVMLTVLGIAGAILLAGCVVAAAGVWAGPWGFTLLYGKEILSHSELILPVLIASVALTLSSFLSTVAVPLRCYSGAFVCNVLGALLCTVLVPWLIDMKGLWGANLGYTLGLAAQIVLLLSLTGYTLRKRMYYGEA